MRARSRESISRSVRDTQPERAGKRLCLVTPWILSEASLDEDHEQKPLITALQHLNSLPHLCSTMAKSSTAKGKRAAKAERLPSPAPSSSSSSASPSSKSDADSDSDSSSSGSGSDRESSASPEPVAVAQPRRDLDPEALSVHQPLFSLLHSRFPLVADSLDLPLQQIHSARRLQASQGHGRRERNRLGPDQGRRRSRTVDCEGPGRRKSSLRGAAA